MTTAPYNFVSFPPRVVTGRSVWDAAGLPDTVDPTRCFDRFLSGTMDGYINLDISPLTPFVVGGAEGHDGGSLRLPGIDGGREILAFPGSSIRGMLRHSLAVMLGDHLGLDPAPIKGLTRPEVMNNAAQRKEERLGLLVRDDSGRWKVRPAIERTFLHSKRFGVRRAVVLSDLVGGVEDKRKGLYELFGSTVHVAVVNVPAIQGERQTPAPMVVAIGTSQAECEARARSRIADAAPGEPAGRWADLKTSTGHICSLGLDRARGLVGNFANVHFREVVLAPTDLQNVEPDGSVPAGRVGSFYLVDPDPAEEPLIPCAHRAVEEFRTIIDRQYQQKVLSRGAWSAGNDHWTLEAIMAGMPGVGRHSGIPVHYTILEGSVDALGIASHISTTEADSVNDAVGRAGGVWGRISPSSAVDMLFGRLGGEREGREIAGRLRCGWAYGPETADSTQLPARDLVLLGPRITSRHMRRTPHPDGLHYKGMSMYHHRGWGPEHNDEDWWRILADEHNGEALENDAILTSLRPRRAHGNFRAQIRFTNLTEIEVGLVLLALNPDLVAQAPHDGPAFAHHLGGGRPVGLGAVHIEATAFVFKEESGELAWPMDDITTVELRAEEAVEKAWEFLLDEWESSGADVSDLLAETGGRNMPKHFAEWLSMLRWAYRPAHTNTRQMTLEQHAEAVTAPFAQGHSLGPIHHISPRLQPV